MSDNKDDKEKKPSFTFGPFEQALAVLVVMGFAANPSIPYAIFNPSSASSGTGVSGGTGLSGLPLLSPPLIMLTLIAYVGYHILTRQAASRDRAKALQKSSSSSSSLSSSRPSGSSSSSSSTKPSSSSSSSGEPSSSSGSSSSSAPKPMSSSDVKRGLPSSSPKIGNPEPKKVSGSSSGKDPSSNAFKKNYFLTMQGPGRPALVPFQDGLRPKQGEGEGGMWWGNVPDDASALMAPPLDPDKAAALMKNPWAPRLIEKDIELLKMQKRKKEEEERYQKVANLLQSILGMLLCAVDTRLGVAALIFFLWRHFTLLHTADQTAEKDAIDKEKRGLLDRLSKAKKAGADKLEIQQLQMDMAKL